MSTPARTASPDSFTFRLGSRSLRAGLRSSLLAAMGAVALLAGCSVGNGGLSSNTPPAGGGGVLSFVSLAMPDGIAGRTYSKVAVTSVLTAGTTGYPISPAIVSGTFPLSSCSLSSGTLPPGINSTFTIDSTGSGCVISGTPAAADAGNSYTFIIQALDSNSPPRAATVSLTMHVRPEFTVTAPSAVVANALPAGVAGRTYGQIAGNAAQFTETTTLSATVGNGTVGAANYCSISVTPALATLALNQVNGTNNCILQSTGALTAGSYQVTMSVADTQLKDPETLLAAVPSNKITSVTNASLAIGAPLHLAAAADAVSAVPPAAVQGRAYGTGAGCSGGACLPLTYVVTGGLPSVEPADSYSFSASAGLTGAGITCAATATSAVAKTTCSGTAAGTGTNTFSVSVDDPGNSATPTGTASSTTGSVTGLSLTINAPLSMPVVPDPATNPAVASRAYGTGTGCSGAGGNCVAPTYTPAGGLSPYTITAPSSGKVPAGITCAVNGNTSASCSGSNVTGSTSTFSVSVQDSANATTPAAAAPVAVSKTLTVNGALTLTAPAAPPTAVLSRAYGTGTGCTGGGGVCAPAAFAITGGSGTYPATPNIVSAPGTWACPLSGSNYNCSTTSMTVAGPFPATPSLSLNISDTPTATTPSSSSNTATATLTVNNVLTLAPPAAPADAVAGRSYGVGTGCGGTCTGISFSVSGGLGNYGLATLTAGPNAFTCTGTGSYNCTKTAITGSGSQTVTASAPETGNASTPSATATDNSRTLTIDAPITVASSQPATWAPAVQGRTYGEGVSQNTYTASGGIAPYVSFTPANFPSGFSCTGSGATRNCSSGNVTGAPNSYSPSMTVVDTGNGSTPPATTTSDPNSVLASTLVVDAPLAISAITLPNGLVNYPYPTVAGASTLAATGGLGGVTWVGPGGTPAGACTVSPTGSFPAGTLALNSGTGVISGTPTAASTTAAQFAFQVCVTDTANAFTPNGAAAPATVGNDLTLNVIAPLAYIAETGADEVEIVNTSSATSVATVSTGAGSAPYSVAFSPSGRYAYVTLSGTGKLAVFDAITGAQITGSPFALTTCTAPHGVGATASLVFVACSGSDKIDVVDSTAFAAVTSIAGGAGSAPEGIAIRANGLRVYATLSGTNQLFLVDNSVSPPVAVAGGGITNPVALLTTNGPIPMGIALAPHTGGGSNGLYAYISKQGTGGLGHPDGIEFLDVTSDVVGTSTGFTTSTSSTAAPYGVAVTPDNSRVYVTLSGTDKFDVLNNALSTPALIASSPFSLTGGANPEGLVIPAVSPVPAVTSYLVFIAQQGANNLGVIDNLTPPAADASTPTVTLSGTAPFGAASVPPPQ